MQQCMQTEDAAGMENSTDPDQTVPTEAVRPGSVLLAQTYPNIQKFYCKQVC